MTGRYGLGRYTYLQILYYHDTRQEHEDKLNHTLTQIVILTKTIHHIFLTIISEASNS